MRSVWTAARDVTVCHCNKGNAASKCSDGISCLLRVDGFDWRRDGEIADVPPGLRLDPCFRIFGDHCKCVMIGSDALLSIPIIFDAEMVCLMLLGDQA